MTQDDINEEIAQWQRRMLRANLNDTTDWPAARAQMLGVKIHDPIAFASVRAAQILKHQREMAALEAEYVKRAKRQEWQVRGGLALTGLALIVLASVPARMIWAAMTGAYQ